MIRKRAPITAAIRLLRQHQIEFTDHLYRYQAGGGARHSARELGLDQHQVVKTLIMEDDEKNPLIILMHGDREVSTKTLARTLGAKSISPCAPAVADRHSGYQVGGTSPFATRRSMPVYCEASILELDRIYINGGKRGYLISLSPRALEQVLQAVPIHTAQ